MTTTFETDYDQLNIDEINVLIEETEKEIESAHLAIGKIKRNRTIPANQKEKQIEPFREVLVILRKRCAFYFAKKDEKIPFYDKLPKSNMFCCHYF